MHVSRDTAACSTSELWMPQLLLQLGKGRPPSLLLFTLLTELLPVVIIIIVT